VTTASNTDTARSLIITRSFDAPRELVFSAWTDPERVMEWWGPKDFTGVASELDLRTGGVWRACMRSPEGVDHWSRGTFHVIDAPARLVMSFAWDVPDAIETLITLTFDSDGDSTIMTFHQGIFETPVSRDGHREGWEETFDKLAAYVKMAPRSITT
jgi:uncharacterized protein YndB with AHSA1/START domain